MLTVVNWDKYQSYRSDRGQPPWIKLHRKLMRKPEWIALTDAQRGQLVAIWLTAAERDGVILASAQMIERLCFMEPGSLDLQPLIDAGFIEVDAKTTPRRRQDDRPEVEVDTEVEEEEDILSGKVARPRIPYSEIVDYLNVKAGSNFKSTTKSTQTLIRARFAEGYTLEDFKTVIDKKAAEWLNTEYQQYLRPATLFQPSKFDSYLNGLERGTKAPKKSTNAAAAAEAIRRLERDSSGAEPGCDRIGGGSRSLGPGSDP